MGYNPEPVRQVMGRSFTAYDAGLEWPEPARPAENNRVKLFCHNTCQDGRGRQHFLQGTTADSCRRETTNAENVIGRTYDLRSRDVSIRDEHAQT